MTSDGLPRIGSQLFLNRGDTPQQATAWIMQMADHGLSLVRLFVLRDLIEPQRGVWDFAIFDAVFTAAQQRGIGVILTLMAETAPGWMQQTANNQAQAALDDPEHWRHAGVYLDTVVRRYHRHPALHSWIVWNEANTTPRHSDAVLLRFHAYLRDRYADIAALNRVWYPQFGGFDEITWAHLGLEAGGPVPSFAVTLDYWRFCGIYLHELLADLVARVRAIDGAHPIHLNPHNVTNPLFTDGQDVWASGRLFDFLGCSAHPVWHATRYGHARYDEAIAAFAALMRGAAKRRRFWVSELQGGAAIISGGETHCPTRRDIRRWLWTSIGSGAEAVVYWCFNTRHDGGEGGEWGLLDWQGGSSLRLQETTAVLAALRRHAEVFADCQAQRARVRILASRASWMHGAAGAQGGVDPRLPRNRFSASDAMLGALRVLRQLGVPADCIDEGQLREENGLDGCDMLIMPGCWALEAGTVAALLRFVAGGGRLLVDGMPAWKNDSAFVTREDRQRLEAALGAHIVDVECAEDNIRLQRTGHDPLPGFWTRVILEPEAGATILATDEDGRPVAVQTKSATWWGTNAFQCCFATADQAWIAALADTLSPWREAIAPVDHDGTTVVHHLRGRSGPFALVQNLGRAEQIRVRVAAAAEWCAVDDTHWRPLTPGVHALAIAADGAALMRLR